MRATAGLVHEGGPTREALFDLAGGRLHAETAAWLEQHIASCRECQAARLRIESVLQALEPPAESPFRRQRDLAAVQRRLERASRASRRLWWALLPVAAAAACGLVVLLAWHRTAPPLRSGSARPPPPSAPSLNIIAREGGAELTAADRAIVVESGMSLASGADLVVQPTARVVGQWAEARVLIEGGRQGASLRMGASAGERRLTLAKGRISLDVAPLPAGTTLAVVTADERVEVQGTRFLVDKSSQGTTVAVDRGKVRVSSPVRALELEAGSRLAAGATSPIQPGDTVSLDMTSRWLAGQERARGTLEVMADVPAADVAIDGEPVGKTPLSIALAPGVHRLHVSTPGRLPLETQVDVTAEAPTSFRAELKSILDDETGAAAARSASARLLAQTRTLVAQGNYEQALRLLERLRRVPASATVRARAALLEAQVLRLQRRPAQALVLLARVARGRGHEAEQAQYLLAQTLGRDLGNPARASAAWALALERFPKGIFNEEELYRLGESLLAANDTARGSRALERYLQSFPRGAHAEDAHLLIATARRDRLSDCGRALSHFGAVADAGGPRATLALVGQARCLRALGRLDEARAVYLRYLEVAPRGRFAAEAHALQIGRLSKGAD